MQRRGEEEKEGGEEEGCKEGKGQRERMVEEEGRRGKGNDWDIENGYGSSGDGEKELE